MVDRRGVVVLGATGSIGRSTCNVLRRHVDRFRVIGFTAACRVEELDLLATEFEPDFVVLACSPDDHRASNWTGEWRYGSDALASAATDDRVDVVVNALLGAAGLEAPLAALHSGKRLALANKECIRRSASPRLRAISAAVFNSPTAYFVCPKSSRAPPRSKLKS